ncbi:CoA ester lyase [Rhodococcus rhodnii]|uniref:CoA ester lyase n=1 Tax=Rhodococcus rhodnii TaxID=38312 RepID=A0A6P2CL40_9NOCA|nr:CoA ester lyase [Rhodococcus rhodnii]
MPGPAWLFCPADRPERFGKAAAVADVVILDLEDGVGPGAKDAARRAVAASDLDPERTVVRVNGIDSPEHTVDLAMLADTPYERIMLPKAESGAAVEALAPREVLALVETPLGALAVREIAAAGPTIGVMWGAEDLVASLGGSASRDRSGTYRDVARTVRSLTLLAAKAHGRLALDAVHVDLENDESLAAEAADAAATGFDVKVSLHPRQVDVVRRAFAPGDDEIDWAEKVLDAAAGQPGAFRFEGAMIDAPVLRHAERILRSARRGDLP